MRPVSECQRPFKGKLRQDRSTPENRAYWDSIEKIAAEVRADIEAHPWKRVWVEHMFCNMQGDNHCSRGDGKQTCREYEIERQQ